MYFYLSVEFQLFALCNVSLNRFASNIYFFVSMRVLIIYQENYSNLGFACMLIETLRTIKRASDSWLPQFTPDSSGRLQFHTSILFWDIHIAME